MRFSVLIILIILVSMDTMIPASALLVLHPGRRSIREWSHPFHSPQGDQTVKGLTSNKVERVAEHGARPRNNDNSEAYFTETQHSSNTDAEEMVYTIDYHGATTHPTPTPKHP